MGDPVSGIEACPDCGGELATSGLEGDRPAQTATRSCPDCSATVEVGLCWYPDDSYVVIGNATERQDCDCGQETQVVGINSQTQHATWLCTDCVPGHLSSVLEQSR